MPIESQKLMAWAAIVGTSFSFSLMKRVMSCDCSKASPKGLIPPQSQDPVAGLQAAIHAFIIMPTEDEDKFRFSHDRYVVAARALSDDFQPKEMHYVISLAMLKHELYDPVTQPSTILFDQARHVCEAIEVIKHRVQHRAQYRDLLYQAAETARESGARKSGLHYFECCIELLQNEPWDDANEDSSYAETLALYTRAAEAYWYVNDFDAAGRCLGPIFAHAREPTDKAPASIICSRISTAKGDSRAAFGRLKRALAELGVEVPEMTWEECDDEYHRLMPLLRGRECDLKNASKADRRLSVLGAVFVELASASFWMVSSWMHKASP